MTHQSDQEADLASQVSLDLVLFGVSITKDGKRVDPLDVEIVRQAQQHKTFERKGGGKK